MMEHKRDTLSLEQNHIDSVAPSKRHKGNISITRKAKQEKIGERIQALQQLVSPFGKTDTASVLFKSIGYISFLHEQIKVLSSPYLESKTNAETQGWESCTLRNKGLCLVPISLTVGLANDNGADIWAPSNTINPHISKSISDETSLGSHY